MPTNQIDTNAAYQLATQFLVAARVDVKRLDRDCKITIKPSDFWNGLEPGGQLRQRTFVPIYDVFWKSPTRVENSDVAASVEVFTPTRTLLQLSVYQPGYILRDPIVFTNLAALLQTNRAPGAPHNRQ